jgi:hypothetical protein
MSRADNSGRRFSGGLFSLAIGHPIVRLGSRPGEIRERSSNQAYSILGKITCSSWLCIYSNPSEGGTEKMPPSNPEFTKYRGCLIKTSSTKRTHLIVIVFTELRWGELCRSDLHWPIYTALHVLYFLVEKFPNLFHQPSSMLALQRISA